MLESGSEKSENDSNEILDDKEKNMNNVDQISSYSKKSPSQCGCIKCLSVDIPTETPHSSSPSDSSEEDDEQTLQQQASSRWTLPSRPSKCKVCD
jgi:hypothetical protein